MLDSAQERLRLATAYFAPDDDFLDTLCAAARRGVEVDLCCPARTRTSGCASSPARRLRATGRLRRAGLDLPAVDDAREGDDGGRRGGGRRVLQEQNTLNEGYTDLLTSSGDRCCAATGVDEVRLELGFAAFGTRRVSPPAVTELSTPPGLSGAANRCRSPGRQRRTADRHRRRPTGRRPVAEAGADGRLRGRHDRWGGGAGSDGATTEGGRRRRQHGPPGEDDWATAGRPWLLSRSRVHCRGDPGESR